MHTEPFINLTKAVLALSAGVVLFGFAFAVLPVALPVATIVVAVGTVRSYWR